MNSTITDEKLGPVDLGHNGKFYHLANFKENKYTREIVGPIGDKTLCGEPLGTSEEGATIVCPDCDRIAKARYPGVRRGDLSR